MTTHETNTTSGVRICPTCNGTGINPVATYLLCPKCYGEKWLVAAQVSRALAAEIRSETAS